MAQTISADTARRIRGHTAALGDPDQAISFRAQQRLIRFGAKAVGQLIEAAASPDPQVRFRAVWALGKSRDPRAFETILRLTGDPDKAVAYDATLALGEMGDTRSVPRLQEMAARAEDERGLVGASRGALRKLGHPIPAEPDEGAV